jgi:hypothetical protein
MKFSHGTSAAMAQRIDSRETQTSSGSHAGPAFASSGRESRFNHTKFSTPDSKEFKLQHLAMLSLTPIVRSVQRWWLQRAERHYLICADVEQQRAREAQMNVAYYQKRAALARSARI